MPYIDAWTNNGLHREFHDSVTAKEILLSNLSLQDDMRLNKLRYVINEFLDWAPYYLEVARGVDYVCRLFHNLEDAHA